MNLLAKKFHELGDRDIKPGDFYPFTHILKKIFTKALHLFSEESLKTLNEI